MGELTGDEAAELAGMTKASFLTRMSQLNGTPDDLRTPKVPGRRARTYDEAKVRTWIEAGRPAPATSRPAQPSGPRIRADATRTERGWSISGDGHTAVADTFTGAADQLAHALGSAPSNLEISFPLADEAKERWNAGREARRQAEELRARSSEMERLACEELYQLVGSQDGVGLILGITRSHVSAIMHRDKQTT
ncbi:hypothetical protein [Arthrobacter woluwensis]|uniref:hypothetical protein n=1 Tax=Arthrobacter woluwensis TaxID=156980 RepID=UPI00382B3397